MSTNQEQYQQSLILRNQYNDRRHVRYMEQLKAGQDFMVRYVQIMVSIGYIGFLAIWAGVCKEVPVWHRAWSGGLMLLSAGIYISYELVVSMFTVLRINEISDVADRVFQAAEAGDEEEFIVISKEWKMVEDRDEMRKKKVFLPIFLSSSLSGLGAVVILIFGILKSMAPELLEWFGNIGEISFVAS